MHSNNSVDLQSQLKQAYQELEGKQPQAALQRLKKMRLHWPNSSDLEHLIALSYKSLGDVKQSQKYFLQCLKIDQAQPEVHNNFANLLKSQGQLLEAEKHYVQALSLHTNYLQAQRNLAICYQAQAKHKAAITAFRQAIKLSPNDVSSINGVADCLRLMGDSTAAHQAYEQALVIDPGRLKSWHNLGLNFHLQGKLVEAIDCYRKAYEISPNSPEVTESLALSLYESGEVVEPIELFKATLNVDPSNVQLHERFNSMLWETEFSAQFGESYDTAIERLTDSSDVALSYASMLYRAGKVQQADSIINSPELKASEHFEVLSLRGQIAAELGDYASAYQSLTLSLEQQYSKEVARQMVKIDLVLARYTQAQKLLTVMFTHSPDCQLSWALQSLVWRLCGDSRYHWLCDYPKFVQAYQLEAPAAYASLDDFLLAIREVLMPMHRNVHEPLQQTLRNGTQTAARLLHTPNPVLRQLSESLTSIVKRYIQGLPDDKTHPLLSRKGSGFEFSGSWSVKLRANGFHVNHVHPEGWISSSCYLSTPESMELSGDLDRPHQGHIKFGESPLQLADRERIELSLQPKPGMVVLFPSYFWHGTYPFDGGHEDFRLTAPFDVVPR
ncbi:MAG: Tfp pilus assembly protein PilF [Arenicella sp.]|jgi:Tfp pilus assembly protein PilF